MQTDVEEFSRHAAVEACAKNTIINCIKKQTHKEHDLVMKEIYNAWALIHNFYEDIWETEQYYSDPDPFEKKTEMQFVYEKLMKITADIKLQYEEKFKLIKLHNFECERYVRYVNKSYYISEVRSMFDVDQDNEPNDGEPNIRLSYTVYIEKKLANLKAHQKIINRYNQSIRYISET